MHGTHERPHSLVARNEERTPPRGNRHRVGTLAAVYADEYDDIGDRGGEGLQRFVPRLASCVGSHASRIVTMKLLILGGTRILGRHVAALVADADLAISTPALILRL